MMSKIMKPLIIIVLSAVLSACDLLLGGTYEVKRLDEYVDYVGGRDLYHEKHVGALKFACEDLRDQVVSVLHQSMFSDPDLKLEGKLREELERLELLGAKREGKTLHLMNDVTVGAEGLDAWRTQLTELFSLEPENVRENWAPAVIRRLFDSVVLHAGNRQLVIGIDYRPKCN
jgi:hypothetical protein